jgi:O-antigen/teichoic acid export membrane protein
LREVFGRIVLIIRPVFYSFQNNFFKDTAFTGLATLVKLGSTFIMSKMFAIYLGPQGLSLLGNLWNTITLFNTVASGGLSSAVVKFSSEFREEVSKRDRIISSAFSITLWTTLITSIFLIIFSKKLSFFVLGTVVYYFIFIILGLSMIFSSLNSFIVSVVNGGKDYKFLAKINISSSLVMLIVIASLTSIYGIKGALVGSVFFQLLVFFSSYYLLRCEGGGLFSGLRLKIDRAHLHDLFGYSLISIVPAIIVPLSQIFIRNFIANSMSPQSSGLWEAINRLSSAYLLFFTTFLSILLLPKLSETINKKHLKVILRRSFYVILPSLFVFLSTIYLLRIEIIRFLFTEEFLTIEVLFLWQLIGDFFKMGSWILAFLLIAKKRVYTYITIEILINISFMALTIFFIKERDLQGAAIAHSINYFLYFLILSFTVYKYLNEL